MRKTESVFGNRKGFWYHVPAERPTGGSWARMVDWLMFYSLDE